MKLDCNRLTMIATHHDIVNELDVPVLVDEDVSAAMVTLITLANT